MSADGTNAGRPADSDDVYTTQELPSEVSPYQGTINLVVQYCRMGIVPKKKDDIRRAIPTLNPRLSFDVLLISQLTDEVLRILGIEG